MSTIVELEKELENLEKQLEERSVVANSLKISINGSFRQVW